MDSGRSDRACRWCIEVEMENISIIRGKAMVNDNVDGIFVLSLSHTVELNEND